VRDVSADKCGWDVTAQPPMTPEGAIPDARHIEVKGRAKGQDTITVTATRSSTGLNQGEKFSWRSCSSMAIHTKARTIGVASINFNLAELLSRSEIPQALC
jgi:hypothetical protein